jgi:hypothetical protein
VLWAIEEIRRILKETMEYHAWQIPDTATDYMTTVLVNKIDKNPWQPLPTYAEAYLTVQTRSALIELGDTCWFTRAVFPELMQRRGISASYYVQLGQGCYERARLKGDTPVLATMCEHFEFLAEVTHTAVRYQGQFRTMWE